MYGSELSNFSYWWIFPILMMALCFLMMRGRRGRKGSMICGFGSRGTDNQQPRASDSATDILDKRYASGEINKMEYEEMKRTLTGAADFNND